MDNCNVGSKHEYIKRMNRLKSQLAAKIDTLDIERPSNELTYSEIEALYDIYASAKQNNSPNFKNAGLVNALESRTLKTLYAESHSAFYDPLKSQIVSGLAAGLAQSNLQQVHTRQELD